MFEDIKEGAEVYRCLPGKQGALRTKATVTSVTYDTFFVQFPADVLRTGEYRKSDGRHVTHPEDDDWGWIER